jgi:hypothetical protein
MKTNTSETLTSLTSLVSGLKKNQPKGLFLLNGSKYTAAQLVTIVQTLITALQAVGPARGAYLRTVRSFDTLYAQSSAVLRDLKQSLQMAAADNTELLADYGLSPRKTPGAKSPRAKVAAADAAQATRAARHTMGKKQKAKITGATAAASSASSTTPAVNTASAASPTVIAGNPAAQTAVTPVIPGH